jgi:hypothetical protein
MRRQSLLLFRKSYRRRWRCFLGHDLPACNRRRRRGYVSRSRCPSALDGFMCRSYRNPRTHRCGSQVTRIHRDHIFGYRLRARK